MAASKKKTDRQQMVMVDAEKLGQGLKTTFEGVAMIFDSIGVDAGLDELKKSITTDTAEKPSQPEKPVTEKGAKEEIQVTENEDKLGKVTSDDPADMQSEEIKAEDTGQDEDTAIGKGTEGKSPNNISQDDITKIIVQKIRVDRSKNETIGQILKTYGVSKVSDLPTEKYEAFLTDLAAI